MDLYQLTDGLLAVASAALSLKSESGSRKNATIEEYLESLRRTNHTELVGLIQSNSTLLASIENLLKAGNKDTLTALNEVRESLTKLARDAERLVPGKGPSPLLPAVLENFVADIPHDAVIVHLGLVVACVSEFPFSLLSQRGESMFSLDMRDGEVQFSASIFNREGKIACEIVNNEMHVNRNFIFRLDRTPHSLALIDDEKRRLVDIEYINSKAIRMTGEFFLRRGMLVTMNSELVKFAKDDYNIRIVRPIAYVRQPRNSCIDINFPDDASELPEIRLEGIVASEQSIAWTGPVVASEPQDAEDGDAIKGR